MKEHSRLLRWRGPVRRALVGIAIGGCAWVVPVAAQIVPEDAREVRINFVGKDQVWVNDALMRLSPGVRIRDRENILVLPGDLKGRYAARLTTDYNGEISQIWLGPPRPERIGPITP
ncbi:MAG: hypothetical protein KDH20_20630 [Rhodocyclaceae bacterium]|nr:hypothetical protein [Rhodocyclaceae bacterium]